MSFTLPSVWSAGHENEAADLLAKYFNGEPGQDWTGAHFETYGENQPYEITSDDLIAVTMLGVNVPPRAAVAISAELGERIGGLLKEVPVGVDLHTAGGAHLVRRDGEAWQLWGLLVLQPGIDMTIASKIMARKRPRLIPVQDTIVRSAVGWRARADFWAGIRDLLLADEGALVARLEATRSRVPVASHLGLLRVLDIAVWMSVRP